MWSTESAIGPRALLNGGNAASWILARDTVQDPPIGISVDAISTTTGGMQIWPFCAPRARDRLLRHVMC
jgi:hypothetical protein